MARAYYNEHDPEIAAWLEEAAAAGAIPAGDVDRRGIEDVTPADLSGYDQCHFFAGIGGWPLALRQAGWPDDRPVWTGSCPCQPFSSAGKGGGFDDERYLWPSFHWLIAQCRPAVVFGEQVASKDAEPWLDLVQADLEALDYAVGAIPFPAAGVGAPQIRDRIYWVADTPGGQQRRAWQRQAGEAGSPRGRGANGAAWSDVEWIDCTDGRRRPVGPGIHPVAAGVPSRLERLRGYGNALCVPAAAEFVAAYLDCEAAA